MNTEQFEDVGFIKYSGEAVLHGVIDAGSAGMALLGLNEAVRFFNEKQSPEFAKIDYEIPVRTEGGSWIAVVLGSVAGTFALSYMKKAGEKMAENDFKDVGLKDVLKKSMSAIQNLVKLIKHTRKTKGWETEKIEWRNANTEIGIPNADGELLFIPAEQYRWFASLPPQLINKMVSIVRTERSLTIGVRKNGKYEEVEIVESETRLFSGEPLEAEEEEILFPDLEHGKQVRLEGRLIRGNETSNSVGLEYQGHSLNCIPEHGNIRRFKRALFTRCVVEGTVTRLTKQRFVAEKRQRLFSQRSRHWRTKINPICLANNQSTD